LVKLIGENCSLVREDLPCAPHVSTPHCTTMQSTVAAWPVTTSTNENLEPRTIRSADQLPEPSMWNGVASPDSPPAVNEMSRTVPVPSSRVSAPPPSPG